MADDITPAQAMLSRSGMWIVFNARGEQLPDFQGPDSYALRDSLRHYYRGPVEMPGGVIIPFPEWVTMPIQGRMLIERPLS